MDADGAAQAKADAAAEAAAEKDKTTVEEAITKVVK